MSFNPLLHEFDTPFQVPPFHLIQLEHFKPAFEEALAQHKAEITSILENEEEPDFYNTIEALENSGKLLTQISRIFYNLNSADTNDAIQQLAQEMSPVFSKHWDDVNLNPDLFRKVKIAWENQIQLELESDQKKLINDVYKGFIRSGVNLSDSDKTRLRAINERLSLLTLQFGKYVLAETNSFKLIVDNKNDLSGLPESLVEAAAEAAKKSNQEGKWVFTLHNPSVMPFLQYAENRALREKMWNAYQLRCNQNNDSDTKDIVKEIINLRIERSNLLGYSTHADYVLEESMAENPNRVMNLLDSLWKPALEKAINEANDMKTMIKADGESFNLAPWDWSFYAEKIRKERYELDETELSEYFSLKTVREGVFYVVKNLYGLEFRKREDVPVYHKDVIAYEVLEENGDHLGILYMDFHPRESKRGGAWMTSYRSQSVKEDRRHAPIISIVCNFSNPGVDKPALLTFDEVETFFHEFGHALHGLLSNVRYQSQAGTAVCRDFVELPSQVMENWAGDPEVLKHYAKHYKTGESIPDELIAKLQASATFNQGFGTVEYLAASYLDMDYHTRTRPIAENEDLNEIESIVMKKLGLIQEIIPRYRSTYFQHIFSGGYSSGYYSYIWSGVLDTDAFEAFKESGAIFNRELATSFRKNILERGDTANPMEMYVAFRGREPKVDALLKKRGLDKVNA